MAIIGAGFSGLSCALALQQKNIKTILFEQKPDITKNIHTTGIIVDEAITEWQITSSYLRPIHEINLYSPDLNKLSLSSWHKYNFYMTETGQVLQEKLNQIQGQSVEVKLGTKINKIEKTKEGFYFKDQNVFAKYLVLADGANSKIAKDLGFRQNSMFLAGHELEFSLDHIAANQMHVFIHPQICKGYIGWVVPGVSSVQVGLAVNKGESLDIETFLKHIHPVFKFNKDQALGKRAGFIPVGGTLRPTFTNNILRIGDSAGAVSPLTAGGIHTAMRYGRLGGEALAQIINASTLTQKQKAKIIKTYERKIPKFYFKHVLKRIYDLLNTNLLWKVLFKTRFFLLASRFVFYSKKRLR